MHARESENPFEWATTWVTTSTDDDGTGIVQVIDLVTEEPLQEVTQLGLPGVYARGGKDVRGFLLRLENGGGVCVAAYTDPPSDAVVDEVGFYGKDGTSPIILRVLPGALGDFCEVKGGRVMDTVILCSDGVTKYVGRDLDPVVTPLGVSVGTLRATTIKVKAG